MYKNELLQELRDLHFKTNSEYLIGIESQVRDVLGSDWNIKVNSYFENLKNFSRDILEDHYRVDKATYSINIYRDLLRAATLVYRNSDIIEEFVLLPKKCKYSLFEKSSFLSPELLKQYVRYLLLLDMSDIVFYGAPEKHSGKIRSLSQTSDSYAFRNPQSHDVSDEFMKMTSLLHPFSDRRYRFKRSLLHMVREYYGEEMIMEVYGSALKEDVKITSIQISQIAEQWSQLKDYPLSWSIQTFGNET